jgi:hypothetical protein
MLNISFDIGTKNLAFVIMTDDLTIENWDVISIDRMNTTQIVSKLKTLFDNDDVNVSTIRNVLLEKQPSRNVKMRVVENTLDVFFTMIGIKNVVHYSAKHKLGSIGKNVRGTKNYSLRKKYAISMCRAFLKSRDHICALEMFESHKKKDDLSDCLLQCVSYIDQQLIDTLSTCILTIDLQTNKPTETV